MDHVITLSNGRQLVIEELMADASWHNRLNIHHRDAHEGDVTICTITDGGVLCSPDSGEHCELLVTGMGRPLVKGGAA